MLIVDLLLVHRTADVITIREAAIESAVWISLELAFGVVVLKRAGADVATPPPRGGRFVSSGPRGWAGVHRDGVWCWSSRMRGRTLFEEGTATGRRKE